MDKHRNTTKETTKESRNTDAESKHMQEGQMNNEVLACTRSRTIEGQTPTHMIDDENKKNETPGK